MSPTIAAVIPVRNRPDVLVRAIESIQAQTLPVSEIIVVDDCSTDDTVDRVLAMGERDPRVRVIRQPAQRGASAARNVGIAAATADWIAFLDSDDEWLPAKLERQFAGLLADPNLVASFTSHESWLVDSKEKDWILPPAVTQFDLMKWNAVSTTTSAVARRSALQAVSGFDETLPACQDWDLWIRLRGQGDFYLVQTPLVRFYKGGNDRISINKTKVLTGHATMFRKIMASAPQGRQRRQIAAAHQIRLAQIHIDDMGEPFPALKHAVAALWFNPTSQARYLTKRGARETLSQLFSAKGASR